MFLQGFGIGGYRSFGQELQRIGPLEKVNLLVGQNNSGKSNVVRFVDGHLDSVLSQAKRGGTFDSLDQLDIHQPDSPSFQFAIAFREDGEVVSLFKDKARRVPVQALIDLLVEEDALAWTYFRSVGIGSNARLEPDPEWLKKITLAATRPMSTGSGLQTRVQGHLVKIQRPTLRECFAV